MLKTYYILCLSFLLIITESAMLFCRHSHRDCRLIVVSSDDLGEVSSKCAVIPTDMLGMLLEVARCEPDYVFNFEADGWLKLYSEPKAWEEAFIRCHKDDAVLASPLNKELAKALLSQMTRFGVNGHIFMGIHDLYSKGNFVSVEGVPLSDMYIKWGSRGNVTDTGDCLTMSVDGSAYYSSCTEPLPFICYRKPNNQTINECGTFDNDE